MKTNAPTQSLPQINTQTRVLFVLFSVLIALQFSQSAQAQTWNGGGGDDNWGTTANWTGGSPLPGTTTDISFDGSTRLTPNNNYTAYDDFRNVLFNSGAGAFTISGSAIDLFGKVENNSTTAQTFNLTLGVNTTFIEINPVSGDLTIGSPNIYLNANQLRVYGNNAKTLTFTSGSVISGTLGTLALNQNSTVVFNSAHTYTGDTFINAGTLQLNSGGSAASSTIRLGDTTGSAPATLAVASGGNANSTIGVRSGSSGVKTINTTAASGTATVSGSVYLDADVTINSTNGGTLSFTGTEFDLKNQTATVTVSNASSVSASTVFKNSSGSGKLTKTGAGTLTLSGASTYTGETKIQKGIVVASGGNDRLPVGTAVSLGLASSTDTGVLQLGDSVGVCNQTLASLVRLGNGGTANAVVGGNSSISTLTINNSGSFTFDGLLGGVGLNQNNLALTKTGAGMLTLTSASTYSGATAIQNGTVVLQAGNDRLPATTAVTLGSGTTSGLLQLGNSVTARSQTLTSLTTSGTGTGNRVVGAHATSTSTLTLNNSSDVTYDGFLGGPGSNQDRLALTKTGVGTLTLSAANTFSGGINLSAGQLNINNAGSGGTSSAIGTGTLTIGSGTIIDNTSAGAVVLSTANPVTLGGNFTFGGTQNLTFGSGTVALTFPGGTPTRTITLNGNNKTLTFGGSADMASLANNTTFEVNGAGNKLVLGALDLNADANARNHTWSGSANVSINGAVTPGGNTANRLLYTGSGTMTLNGNNTYNGLTTMNNASGTLILNGANTGTGGTTVSAGTLSVNTIADSGTSALGNSGTLTLGGGKLSYSGAGDATTTRSVTLTAGSTLDLPSGGLTLSGATTGGQILTKSGSGTLTLSGTADNANLLLNATAGEVRLEKTSTSGIHAVAGISGIANGATVKLTGTGGDQIFNGGGANQGVNGLVAGGMLNLNGFSETISFLSGTGGTVEGGSGTPTLTVGQNNVSSTFGGVIQNTRGTLTLIKTGVGTQTLSGANTYSGSTTLTGGTLTLNNNLALQNSALVTGGGNVTLGAGITTPTFGGLSGSTALATFINSGYSSSVTALTLNPNSGAVTYGGVIANGAGGMTLTKTGAGTQTLSGVNTYSGATTISAGTLALSGSGSISSSPIITVASGATFNLSALSGFTLGPGQTLKGNGTVTGNVLVQGTLAAGASIGTLTNLGNVTWAPGGTNVVELGGVGSVPGVDGDFLSIGGELLITVTNNAPAANKFTVKLVNPPGGITNFLNTVSNFWPIAMATNGVFGFNSNKFNLEVSVTNALGGGQFTLELRSNLVAVLFTPSPAPCSFTTTNWFSIVVTPPNTTNAVMTFSNDSYLTSVQALTLSNCTLTGQAYTNGGPNLTDITGINLTNRTPLPFETYKLVLTAVKETSGLPAAVNALVIDTCGRGKSFDPVITTLTIVSGNRVTQRFEGLISAERYLRVLNATPGLKWLEINLNGRVFRLDPLAAGQDVAADLGSAMHEGDNNVVILTGGGDVGASAFITITDAASDGMVALSEIVSLTLSQTADGLVLAWPETLAGWQLQGSAAPDAGWVNVTPPPVPVRGQWTVTILPTQAAQFYRLSSPTSAALSAGAALKIAATNQPELFLYSYDGIAW